MVGRTAAGLPVSLDWIALLVALLAVGLVRAGLVWGVPW
jgi:hypothetical protein